MNAAAKHWSCPCGFRAEGDTAPQCETCREPMNQWEPPIVPENWYSIGQLLRRSPDEVAQRAGKRGRK